jgi:hypothetical protein
MDVNISRIAADAAVTSVAPSGVAPLVVESTIQLAVK